MAARVRLTVASSNIQFPILGAAVAVRSWWPLGQETEVSMFADWATGFKGRPVSLFFLVLGALCVLLGVTSGFAVPVLQEIVADPSYRLLTLLLGLVFLAAGSALYYFPK